MQQKTRKPKIGFTFSGGGTRSVAQIGVIKALRENDIEAYAVAGNSGGSIVATLYAAGKTTDEMLAFIENSNIYKLYKPALPTMGLTSLDYLAKMLDTHVKADSFEELFLPLYITATNLMKGKIEVFNSGPLFQRVIASCSIPLLFKPVEIDGQLYADGGIFENMPVAPLKKDCDIIIGVNVMPNVSIEKTDLESIFSIGTRVFDLMIYNTTKDNFAECDVVIQPNEVYKHNIFTFDKFDEFFQYGYEQAMRDMKDIKRVIAQFERAELSELEDEE